ncbi:(2Fe-2S)-binding protein [Gluconobacter oxydans]|uniref:(2Fe-2S)-binding protein n=1 Tax=Gluconobacter oxydans TaxID=442 RepID=UPI0039E82B85
MQSVTFTFLSQAIEGIEGEPVAAALRRAGITELGQSGVDGTPRGAFCFMGSCQECRVRIDGTVAYACKAPVLPNMTVTPYVQS